MVTHISQFVFFLCIAVALPTFATSAEEEEQKHRDSGEASSGESNQNDKQEELAPSLKALEFSFRLRGTDLKELISKVNGDSEEDANESLQKFLASLDDFQLNLLSLDKDLSWLQNEKRRQQVQAFIEAKRNQNPASQSVSTDPSQTSSSSASSAAMSAAKTLTSKDREIASKAKALRSDILSMQAPKDFDPNQPYTPGSDPLRDKMKEMAKLYSHFYGRNAEQPGRDESLFPFLEETTARLREKQRSPNGGSPLEKMWEHELSQAINERANGLNTDGVMRDAVANSEEWAAKNGMGEPYPRIAGANSVEPSYEFVKKTMEAMGLLAFAANQMDSGKSLTPEQAKKVKDALADWANHDFVKLRPDEQNQPALRTLGNQYLKWGKVFSMELMNEINRTPSLRQFLPKELSQSSQFETLYNAMEKSLFKNAQIAMKGGTEDGVGGSNDHSAMVFSMLNSLSKEHQAELMPKLQSLLESKGAKDGLLQYAPFRNLPVNATFRDSAGRGVGLALAEFQNNPTEENAKKAIERLEQFNLYAGSLKSHVTRSGVHAGEDRLAPYYWSPNLFSAGRLVSDLAEKVSGNPEAFSSDTRARLEKATNELERSVLSTWNRDQKRFAHMGKETYQQLGPTTDTSAALVTLRHLNKAKSFLGEKRENDHGSSVPNLAEKETPPAPSLSPVQAFSEKLKQGLPSDLEELQALKSEFQQITEKANPKNVEDIKQVLSQAGLKADTQEYKYFLSSALSSMGKTLPSSEISELLNLQKQENLTPVRAQAALALEAQRNIPENKLGLDWLEKAKPFGLNEDEALLKAVQRREAWDSGDAEKQKALAKELAQEMYSVNPEVRKELRELALNAQEKAPTSSLNSALGQLYAGNTVSNRNLGDLLATEKAAARQRALDWNKKLAEGDSDWLKEQIKQTGGEDRFLKWAAQAGGETGNQALKQAIELNDSAIQVKNRAQGYQPGDILQIRIDQSPAEDLHQLLLKNRTKGASLEIALRKPTSASGRIAFIDPNGEIRFKLNQEVPDNKFIPPAPVDFAMSRKLSSIGPSLDLTKTLKNFVNQVHAQQSASVSAKAEPERMVFAYFGPKDKTLEARIKQKHPNAELKNFPFNSPEYRYARSIRAPLLLLRK